MSVNQEIKGSLAKLLATENLVVEHKKVATACFDIVNRVLTLPIWDKASATVYDLLVGHEVGHALYTPPFDWREEFEGPKDYINVIEDARIEKLMKRKYPGLGKSFYNGYKELNDDNFFCIEDENINSLSLIDRINLHFKIGPYACIPFKEKEIQFIEMTENAESFDDVIEICKKLFQYIQEEKQDSVETSSDSSQVNQDSQSGSQSNSSVNGNTQFKPSDSGESGDSNFDSIDENIDGSKKSNSMQESSSLGSGGGPNEEVSKTQRSFNEETEKLTNQNIYDTETVYVELPEFDINNVIVPFDKLLAYISNHYKNVYLDKKKHWGNVFESSDASYANYKKNSQKEVNYLVKEFEMKKSADAYQRSATAKTGVLDTSKLHMYNYNEDLFKKISVVPDGKNHGLIFILDWSGSMSDYILDTIKQLLNLVWFCKKVQIPFEVYAFTYEWSNTFLDGSLSNPPKHDRKHGTLSLHNRFYMMNLISSKCNSKNFETACLNLWRLAYANGNARSSTVRESVLYSDPLGLELSGTPLCESIISLHKIIPQFKNQNKLQKVNVVILTDGESNNICYDVDLKKTYDYPVTKLGNHHVGARNALRDRKTGRVYRNFGTSFDSGLTTIFLENLKHNFPEINLIGFRILSGSEFSNLLRCSFGLHRSDELPAAAQKIQSEWKKEKCAEINFGVGYDALYAISFRNLSVDTTFKVDENASTSQIGKAFRGMLKAKTTNKKILSSFTSLVS